MTRARNIKPGFYKNEDLAECSLEARFLFPGLWMLADREGRLEDRPKRIKGEIFPYDSVDIESLLQELVKWGFIERYSSDGKNVIFIKNFSIHQKPHSTEKDSDLPDQEGNYIIHERNEKTKSVTGNFRKVDGDSNTITVNEQLKNCYGTVNKHTHNALNPDSLNPDSLNPSSLNPSSLNPSSLNPSSLNPSSLNPENALEISNARARFQKPTKTEIHDFCEQEKICIDADVFLDYYDANGWMVGKSKMKDWRATVRNWARRDKEFSTAQPRASPRDSPQQEIKTRQLREI